MRVGVAHEIEARVHHAKHPLADAAEQVIADIGRRGGSGGLIAVDAAGQIAMPFTSRGMYRGSIDQAVMAQTAIYRKIPHQMDCSRPGAR